MNKTVESQKMYSGKVMESSTKTELGFGLMRLPKTADKEIDIAQTCKMVDTCLENGFNYFDTASLFPKDIISYLVMATGAILVLIICSA